MSGSGSGSMSFASSSSSSAVVVAQKKSAFSSSSSSSNRQKMMKLTQRRRQRQRRGDENNNNFLSRAMAIQEGGEVKTTYVTLPDEKVLVAHAKTAVNSGIHTVALECKPSLPKGLILHWGVIRGGEENGKKWHVLPQELFPPGTTVYKEKAMQTPFPRMSKLVIVLDAEVTAIHFALKNEETGKWITGPNKKDFVIRLDGKGTHTNNNDDGSSDGAIPPTAAAVPTPSPPPIVVEVPEPIATPSPPTPAPASPSLITNAYVKPSDALDNLIKVVAFTKWEEKGRQK